MSARLNESVGISKNSESDSELSGMEAQGFSSSSSSDSDDNYSDDLADELAELEKKTIRIYDAKFKFPN